MGEAGKWACCNVGAKTPWEYGGYYGWGETEEKEDYNEHYYTYYRYSRYIPFDDIAGNQDLDVAAMKWGGAWKMPKQARIEKLLNNCTYEWTTLNQLHGAVFSAQNGNRIFLPAAGYRDGTNLEGAGSYGNYWSSTPNPSRSHYADGLYFSTNGPDWGDAYYRFYGHTVRPVE